MEASHSQVTGPREDAMQIGMALEKYVLQLRADGRSAHTIGQYRRHVRLLDGWLGAEQRSRQIERINHEDLAQFLASPTAQNRKGGGTKKPTTSNTLRSSLRVFFAYCEGAGYCKRSPARLVRRARCGTPPPRALSEEEQKRLLAVLAEALQRDRALFVTMLKTGIRLGSALALNVEDVDLERSELRLRQAKGDREERAFIPKSRCKELRTWIGDRTSGPLFPGKHGKAITPRHAARRFRALLEAAGIRRVRGSHCLRHTFAMRVYKKTGDLMVTQAALGHASIVSTTVYAQADTERLRKALGT